MQTLPSTIADCAAWADEAARRKDWLEAIKRWALTREKFPEYARGYVGGAAALKERKDFVAADGLVLEGLEKFPKEVGLYIEYGDIAAREKDWPEAARRWALMREKAPGNATGYFRGAEALKERGDFAAADAVALAGLEKFPKEAWLYIEYGDIATRRKDWPEAARRWALMRERCPERPNGYTRGGNALKEQGEYAAADAIILEGLTKFPEWVWFYIEYGDIAARQKNWPEAARRWALMREKAPGNATGYFRGAAALKERGDFAAADAVALAGLEKFPKDVELHIQYGDIATRRKDWPEAARRWALMRENVPEHPRGYQSGASALKENREFAAADAVVLAGLEKFPKEVWLYIEYGDIAARQKNWPEAARRWALMREKAPGNATGYFRGAAALKERGDFAAADAVALAGLEKFPKEVELHIQYGDMAERRKDWPEAARRWALMREKFPEHPRGYLSGTVALKENQDMTAAEAVALAGLKKFPKEAGLYAEYGDIAMRQRDWPEAARRWALMREKAPGNATGYFRGAAALKERGDFAAADAVALAGLEKFPKEAELSMQYGDIAARQKNWPEAARRWALMREKFPEHPRGYQSGASALKENREFAAADAVALAGLEKFPKEAGLYAEYGDIAVRQRDWPEAARRWALMREKFPEHPRGYLSGTAVLKERGDFAAADALILEGLGRFPKEAELYMQYGDIAVRRKNWPEAARRWALMREKLPEHPRGYQSGASALKENREFAAADAVALAGLKKFPKEAGLYAEYGDIAARQRDWPEAARRWALMREKAPEHPCGYLSGTVALKENREFAAADAVALAGLAKFPKEAGLYAEYGDIAMRQRDWPEAARRWALMREKAPGNATGHFRGAAALKERGDFAAADALILEGLQRFPKEAELHIQYGDVAARQKNWPEAARRWTLMREKLPEHPRGYQSGVAALKENRDFAAAEALVLAGLKKFPKEAGLCVEYCDIAVRQRDWSEAGRRWALIRERLTEHPRGSLSGTVALKENRDVAVADALARTVLEKSPKAADIRNERLERPVLSERISDTAQKGMEPDVTSACNTGKKLGHFFRAAPLRHFTAVLGASSRRISSGCREIFRVVHHYIQGKRKKP